MDKEILTLKEFAKKIPYSERWVRQMCINGKIEAEKISDDARKWLIPASELERLKAGSKFPSKAEKSRTKPYEETPHKQQMREMADKVAAKMWLPLEFGSFIYERTFGYWFIGNNGFEINISETGKIEPVLDMEEYRGHLYEGLLSHLHTGGFADAVTNIAIWKRESGEILAESQKLFKIIVDDVGEKYSVIFSFDSLEQAGFTPDFFKTIHRGAIFGTIPDASQYRLEGCRLRLGVYHIYSASTNADLETYRDAHIELQGKYAETDLAKQIGKQVRKLLKTQENIRNQLEKFKDMERLPGHCQLCS